MLCQINHTEKGEYWMIPVNIPKTKYKKKKKIPKHIGKKIRLVVARGRGWREGNQRRVVRRLKVLVMEKQVLGCDAPSDNCS